jgi:hypothetical protein
MVYLNTGDWWEWQERQFQDWLLDQKINGVFAKSSIDDEFLDELNAELQEIETDEFGEIL